MAAEVGLAEARRMATEVRKWWIGEMQREATGRPEAGRGRRG